MSAVDLATDRLFTSEASIVSIIVYIEENYMETVTFNPVFSREGSKGNQTLELVLIRTMQTPCSREWVRVWPTLLVLHTLRTTLSLTLQSLCPMLLIRATALAALSTAGCVRNEVLV